MEFYSLARSETEKWGSEKKRRWNYVGGGGAMLRLIGKDIDFLNRDIVRFDVTGID